MARKRSKMKAPRRRKNKAINLLTLGENLLVANVVSNTVFGNNLLNFLTAGSGLPFAQETYGADGTSKLTLQELLNWKGDSTNVGQAFADKFGSSRGAVITQNVKTNALNGALMLGGIKIGSKIIKGQLRPLFRDTNKVIKMAGFGDMVRV